MEEFESGCHSVTLHFPVKSLYEAFTSSEDGIFTLVVSGVTGSIRVEVLNWTSNTNKFHQITFNMGLWEERLPNMYFKCKAYYMHTLFSLV